MEDLSKQVKEIICNCNLDYKQKKHFLAALAESTQTYPEVSQEAHEARKAGIICDLFEGNAPYRPRYILPDYEKALQNGCEYLELEAPTNLDEAINFLSIFYQHVPSITGYSVYLGNIDQLLLPFATEVSEEELYSKIKLFWRFIDRSLPDAFVHANIGPEDNIVAQTILKVDQDLKQVVPNLTLKYDPQKTTDSLLENAVCSVFETAKPHIANHSMTAKDFKGDYAVVSCYNSLPIGGGSHTLIRLNLKKVADLKKCNRQEFLKDILPIYCQHTLEIIAARSRYLVEEVKYFENDFLAQEKFIELENFSAMFGFFGLAECVNTILQIEGKNLKYGQDQEANDLAFEILSEMRKIVDAYEIPYCEANNNRAFFHAQSGIDIDLEETAGARIPIGQEPDMYSHIMAVAPHHHLCNGGISDIFHFDESTKRNPQAIMDIVKAAFKKGMRMFTFNISNSEFIRITGYLVRRSDLKDFREDGSRYGSTLFGANSMDNANVDHRKAKRITTEGRVK